MLKSDLINILVVKRGVTQKQAEATARLRALPTVATTDSMGERLLEDPRPKVALISAIRRLASTIRFPVPDARPADLSELSQTLWSLQGYLSLVSEELARQTNADPVLVTNVISLRQSLGDFRHAMFQGDRQANDPAA